MRTPIAMIAAAFVLIAAFTAAGREPEEIHTEEIRIEAVEGRTIGAKAESLIERMAKKIKEQARRQAYAGKRVERAYGSNRSGTGGADGGSEPDISDPEGYAEDTAEDAGADVEGDAEDSGAVITCIGTWTISFYCPCEICCGEWATGCTASGTLADPWHTCATDGLEFGTILYVEGLGYFEVLDRGTEYGWLDIYVGDHQTALDLGLQYRDVYIIY